MYIHYIALNTKHEHHYVEEKQNGLIDLLFLYIKTPSILILGGEVHTISSPSAILIAKNTPYKYFPTGPSYVDDYLHFSSDSYQEFVDELMFPLNVPVKISNDMCICKLLDLLQIETIQDSEFYQKNITHLISLLMLKIGEQWRENCAKHSDIPHYTKLKAVRDEIQKHPEKNWTIDELSSKVHLSQAYFQVLYKKAFGITCINEVIDTKIKEAKTLLNSTDLQVNEIAQELGYHEVYHFIRQFKKNTGYTPGAFRKELLRTNK